MIYGVKIAGIGTFNNLEIKVYDEDINFKTLKRKDAGFKVDNIPMNVFQKWLLVGSDRFKEEIDFPGQSGGITYITATFDIYFKTSKNMTSKIVVGNDYWLEKELLNVYNYSGVVTVDGIDYDKYSVNRIYDTTRQYYMSPYYLDIIGYDKNTSKYRYGFSNYIDDFEGLQVWLYREGDVKYRGAIKSISVVNYGVTIDCIPLSETLDFNLSEEGLKWLYLMNDVDLTFWGFLEHTLAGKDIYNGFSPFLNNRPPVIPTSALTYNPLELLKTIIPDFIRNQELFTAYDGVVGNRGVNGNTGVYSFEKPMPKINALKFIYILEVMTGYFMFVRDIIEFKNIYGKVTDFKKNILPHINLKERVVVDKFVSTPFTTLGSIEIKWKEGNTYFNSSTVVSAVGSERISLDLSWLDRTDQREQELLDGFVDRHLYLQDVKVSVLKLQVPIFDDFFTLGSVFIIDDIDEYFTFQGVDNNNFSNEGTVISREDKGSGVAEIEIVIGDVTIIKPLAPFICGEVVAVSTGTVDEIKVEFSNLNNELLFKDFSTINHDLDDDSPFEDEHGRTLWFINGDTIYIFRIEDDYGVEYITKGTITSSSGTTLVIELVSTGLIALGDDICVSYYKNASTGNFADWVNHFLLVGVDKWEN